jgi:hypothetical protein
LITGVGQATDDACLPACALRDHRAKGVSIAVAADRPVSSRPE